LFLQNNDISRVSGLNHLTRLEVLDLSSNHITDISGLASISSLHTLNLAHNSLASLPDLSALRALRVLDLSNNALASLDDCLAVLSPLGLRSLQLQGCPLAEEPSYRRRVVAGLRALRFLDDRPVSAEERRACEAWAQGGAEAEREVRASLEGERAGRAEREMALWRGMRGAAAGTAAETETEARTTTDMEEEEEDTDVAVESMRSELAGMALDSSAVRRVGAAGSALVMGGVEGLFPGAAGRARAEAASEAEREPGSGASVRYSVLSNVRKAAPAAAAFSDPRGAGVDWVAEGRDFGGYEEVVEEAAWPAWLCTLLCGHAQDAVFDWDAVSARVQADVCRAVRRGEAEAEGAGEPSVASAYTADACRVAYFALMVGDEDEDGEIDAEAEAEVDFSALD
jgi:hypothetical protein